MVCCDGTNNEFGETRANGVRLVQVLDCAPDLQEGYYDPGGTRRMRSLDLLSLVAGIVVLGFCLFLVGLAVVIAARPLLAERFLRSFASSAPAHYAEQGVRLLVGAAVVAFSRWTRHPEVFNAFGWLLVITTLALLLIPWQWHRRFAARVMPPVFRHLRLLALGALALAAFILYGVSAAAS